jgi:hypothetical protein
MAAEGIPVRVITLMGNGLTEPYGTPSQSIIDSWIADQAVTDPVLFDRGFHYALFPDFIEGFNGDSFGYPAWLVLDPEMTLFYGAVGFSSWDSVSEVVLEDFEGR